MRVVAAVVVVSLAVTGFSPLAQAQEAVKSTESTPLEQAEQPMTPGEPVGVPAGPPVAQAPTTPPVMPAPVAPPPPPAPPVQPAQPAQPQIFQETLKAQEPSGGKEAFYITGAVVTNIFLIPGRVVTCTLGAGVGVALLALTFGTGYKAAAATWDEGCGGKWVVSGDDLKPEGSRAFEWER
jgi:hypothetical protein